MSGADDQPAVIRPEPESEYWFEEGCFILELSNSPADPALSVARARVPPGGETAWHRLDGITERYVIEQGQGTVSVGDALMAPVCAGDVIVIPPGERQRIRNTGEGDLVFLALCTPRFDPARYEAL